MSDSDTVSLRRPGTWPRRTRLALEAIVTVMANAYMMTRSRAAGSPSKTVRLTAEKDDALWRAAMAIAIRRLGTKVHRSSVQRFLLEKKPNRPARAKRGRKKRTSRIPRHVLQPKKMNRTWHLELTVFPLFGMRFHVAAIVDGFSRKLLALRIYARTPTAIMMSALVKRTAGAVGQMPRWAGSLCQNA